MKIAHNFRMKKFEYGRTIDEREECVVRRYVERVKNESEDKEL